MTRQLILIGGGQKPRLAIDRFLGAIRATGTPRVLVVAWASQVPDEASDDFIAALEGVGVMDVETCLIPPTTPAERSQFLSKLDRAGGVFFTGGDQARIMDCLEDVELARSLRATYRAGRPFAGTSAGTAIMSSPMIWGHERLDSVERAGVRLRPGLGLVHGAIIDQHFLRRARQNRLLAALRDYPAYVGIGVDEDAAVHIVDERWCESLSGKVWVADGRRPHSPVLLDTGDRFDLIERTPIEAKLKPRFALRGPPLTVPAD